MTDATMYSMDDLRREAKHALPKGSRYLTHTLIVRKVGYPEHRAARAILAKRPR